MGKQRVYGKAMNEYGEVLFYCGEFDENSERNLGRVIPGVTDEKGDRQLRTKMSHPYSYDPVCTFFRNDIQPMTSVYDDRMRQWDYKKFDQCIKDTGDYRNLYSNPKRIEQILRAYFGDPSIELQAIIEYCNQSTGYPCWRFDYRYDEKK